MKRAIACVALFAAMIPVQTCAFDGGPAASGLSAGLDPIRKAAGRLGRAPAPEGRLPALPVPRDFSTFVPRRAWHPEHQLPTVVYGVLDGEAVHFIFTSQEIRKFSRKQLAGDPDPSEAFPVPEALRRMYEKIPYHHRSDRGVVMGYVELKSLRDALLAFSRRGGVIYEPEQPILEQFLLELRARYDEPPALAEAERIDWPTLRIVGYQAGLGRGYELADAAGNSVFLAEAPRRDAADEDLVGQDVLIRPKGAVVPYRVTVLPRSRTSAEPRERELLRRLRDRLDVELAERGGSLPRPVGASPSLAGYYYSLDEVLGRPFMDRARAVRRRVDAWKAGLPVAVSDGVRVLHELDRAAGEASSLDLGNVRLLALGVLSDLESHPLIGRVGAEADLLRRLAEKARMIGAPRRGRQELL